MKNKYYYLVALLFLVSNAIFAQAPTTASTNLSFSSTDGDKFRLSFTIGDGAKRIIIAKAEGAVTAVPEDGTDYTHNQTFGSGHQIATGEFVVYDGTENSNILITGLAHSTTYYIKIFEYNGVDISTEYLTASFLEDNEATLSAPTTQASNIQFSNISGTSMRLTWDIGNGTKRLLIIRENVAVNTEPIDLIGYFAHPGGINFSTYEIGTGNYVVYGSTLNSVNVISLNPNTTYHFALFEFNGGLSGNTGMVYLRPGFIASQPTDATPTLNASTFIFSNISGSKFSYQFSKGNGQRRIVIAKQGSFVTAIPENSIDYNHNTTFGLGQQIEPGEFVVFDGTGAVNAIPGLNPNNTYFLKVFEYNGTGTNTVYLKGNDSNNNPPLESSQATISTPTLQATAITFSNVLGTSMNVSWTNGNGEGRLLIIRENAAVNAQPVDLTAYSGAAAAFGNSSFEIGTGNYGVYKGSGSTNTVNVFNLNPNATYHFALFEYNSTVYLRPGATANQLTAAEPTLNATEISFSSVDGNTFTYSFTRGNGGRYITIAKQGSAVTAIPDDFTDYNHNTTFGDGQQIEPGEFVVYDGTFTNRSINGLIPNTTYFLKVFEYNGTGTGTLYLPGIDSMGNHPLVGSQATISTPTTQATNIQFSDILGSSMTVSWEEGNGEGRLLIIRENSAVETQPIDLVNYDVSPSGFGNPMYQIGIGNYVVYSHSGDFVNLTNINTNSTYHFALFEYNGSSGRAYLRPGATTSSLDIDTFNYSIGVKSWPNPSDNYFNIKLTTNNNFDKVEIFVYDINGKQVHYNTFNPKGDYSFGKELAGGVYFVKVIQAGRMKIRRLIKF